MTPREFNKTIQSKRAALKSRATAGLIRNAKEADESAGELAGKSPFHQDSKEFEALLGILFAEAGKLFPGNWEDYPRVKLHV